VIDMTLQDSPEVYGRQMRVGRDEPILDPQLPIIDAHHHLFDRAAAPGRPPLRYLLSTNPGARGKA